MAPRKSSKRRAPRRRVQRKRSSKRNPNNIGGPNTCKVIETLPTLSITNNQAYRIFKAGITGPRASAIAPNFGLYRIAKITYTYKPLYDTFSGSLTAGNAPIQVPYLYWKMNRYADAPAVFNANYLRTQGSKGIRLDDKNITVSYKPNVLLQTSTAGSSGSQVKMTPWLSTDARPDDGVFGLSTTEHQGHLFLVESAQSGGTAPVVCTLDIQVVYEFKNPRAPDSTSVDMSGSLVPINV